MISRDSKFLGAVVLFTTAFSLLSPLSAEESAQPPHVQFDADAEVLNVEWDISSWTSDGSMLFMPGYIGIQQPHQIVDVVCDGVPLRDEDQAWTAPEGCGTLNWTVKLDKEADVSAAEQRSFLDTWSAQTHVLFNDVTSLLHPTGGPVPHSVFFDFSSVSDESCEAYKGGWLCGWNPDGPPDFTVLQNAGSNGGRKLGGVFLIHPHFGEGQQSYLEVASHGLEYIRNILQSVERPFTIYWKRSCLDEEVNAATGEKLVLISGPCTEGADSDIRVLVTVLHEAVHLYSQDKGWLPLWAGESLAMYYGLKASKYTLHEDQQESELQSAYQNMESGFFNIGSNSPGYGLLEAQAKVESGGDPSAYGQFYFRGATFWSRVDAFISRHDMNKNLDDYMPLLASGVWSESGVIPQSFTDQMNAYSHEEWAELLKEFIE